MALVEVISHVSAAVGGVLGGWAAFRRAGASKTSADADLQNAVNEAVKLALQSYEQRIKSLEAQLADALADVERYKTQLAEWEQAGRVIQESLDRKRREELLLRERLVTLEAEKNEAETELAKVRHDLDDATARLRAVKS